jgi:putative ABC transport system substrate-binding protein
MNAVLRRASLVHLGVTVTLLLAGFPTCSSAQTQEKSIRLGLIEYGNSELSRNNMRLLLEGLREHGYVEGKNLLFERRHAEGQGERMPAIADELIALKLDAIVTTCTPSTRLMYSRTHSVPLIMAAVSDPVGQKLIASLARPGGNITGLASQFEDIAGKMLALFREAVPRTSHVAVLFNETNPVHTIFLREIQAAALPIDVRLSPVAISAKTDIAATADEMVARGVNGVLALPDDPMLTNRRRLIVEMATKRGLPSFFGMAEAVDDGGLMSYGENFGKTYFRAAHYVDKVLKGASPAELPVEQPTRFELVVNQKTARSLGLVLPRSILLRADRVID